MVNIEGRIEYQLLDWPVGDPSGISGTDLGGMLYKGYEQKRIEDRMQRCRERTSDVDVRCSQKPERNEIDYRLQTMKTD